MTVAEIGGKMRLYIPRDKDGPLCRRSHNDLLKACGLRAGKVGCCSECMREGSEVNVKEESETP
jgi:hypothetical protein